MLKNRVTIITGGASGIGLATAEKFLAAQAIVVLTDINVKKGCAAAAGLENKGRILFVRCDVASETDIKKLVSITVKNYRRIDIIINNAGIGDWRSMEKRPMKVFNRILAVNLTAQYMLVKYASRYMPAGSSVVNISSTRAIMSEPGSEPYAAGKAGIIGLTHALASSLAERRIRVNAVSPGWINVSGYTETKTDRAQHFVKRVGRGTDIAEACAFLADEEKGGFITGQNLIVDGGMTRKMIYL